jgi:hypothetical protein
MKWIYLLKVDIKVCQSFTIITLVFLIQYNSLMFLLSFLHIFITNDIVLIKFVIQFCYFKVWLIKGILRDFKSHTFHECTINELQLVNEDNRWGDCVLLNKEKKNIWKSNMNRMHEQMTFHFYFYFILQKWYQVNPC